MSYMDPETNEKYVPYCIEPSLGADRVALAFLTEAYDEEVLTDSKGKEDVRTVLRLHPALAPFKAAVLPLAKKLAPVAEPIYEELAKHFSVDYDVTGSIGKRYRREDEIGTPFSICVDFDTETDGCVTVRDRDTMEQIRIPVEQVKEYICLLYTSERELTYLFVHSVLHLLGYDHMEDEEKKEMRAREEEVMTQLGIGR